MQDRDVRRRPPSGPGSGGAAAVGSLMGMGLTRYLPPDFGAFAGYGIPINLVTASTPRKTVTFEWPGESDPSKYPIPASPLIEGAGAGGDRHLLAIDMSTCKLWELFAAS